MHRRRLLALLVALLAVVTVSATLVAFGPAASNPPGADQRYPEGTGPDHVDFSTLDADDANVSHAPREHWDAYAIVYTEPPERPRVEGNYYVNASTGEVVSERWYDARDYRDGDTYAFVQPAGSIPDEHRREQFESDDSFVYDDATDAYYRYDPHYGRIAPTTIGRHTDLLEAYTWEAVDATTHHGVPVVTYEVTGTRSNDSRAPPAQNGTLRLGVDDGVVYAFDLTVADDGTTYRYEYEVRPAPFPDHDWVARAKALAAGNATDAGSSD